VSLNLTYSQFLIFCFSGNPDEFYKGLRWTNWIGEISQLDGTKVFNFHPNLWTKESKDVNKDSRLIVPIEDQYKFNMEAMKNMAK
jgi:hypothetical protein